MRLYDDYSWRKEKELRKQEKEEFYFIHLSTF